MGTEPVPEMLYLLNHLTRLMDPEVYIKLWCVHKYFQLMTMEGRFFVSEFTEWTTVLSTNNYEFRVLSELYWYLNLIAVRPV
jgi:hypothetical protein